MKDANKVGSSDLHAIVALGFLMSVLAEAVVY